MAYGLKACSCHPLSKMKWTAREQHRKPCENDERIITLHSIMYYLYYD